MRKTRLVILPRARSRTHIFALLLFLACPNIAFQGRDRQDIQPSCSFSTSKMKWLQKKPESEFDTNLYGEGIGRNLKAGIGNTWNLENLLTHLTSANDTSTLTENTQCRVKTTLTSIKADDRSLHEGIKKNKTPSTTQPSTISFQTRYTEKRMSSENREMNNLLNRRVTSQLRRINVVRLNDLHDSDRIDNRRERMSRVRTERRGKLFESTREQFRNNRIDESRNDRTNRIRAISSERRFFNNAPARNVKSVERNELIRSNKNDLVERNHNQIDRSNEMFNRLSRDTRRSETRFTVREVRNAREMTGRINEHRNENQNRNFIRESQSREQNQITSYRTESRRDTKGPNELKRNDNRNDLIRLREQRTVLTRRTEERQTRREFDSLPIRQMESSRFVGRHSKLYRQESERMSDIRNKLNHRNTDSRINVNGDSTQSSKSMEARENQETQSINRRIDVRRSLTIDNKRISRNDQVRLDSGIRDHRQNERLTRNERMSLTHSNDNRVRRESRSRDFSRVSLHTEPSSRVKREVQDRLAVATTERLSKIDTDRRLYNSENRNARNIDVDNRNQGRRTQRIMEKRELSENIIESRSSTSRRELMNERVTRNHRANFRDDSNVNVRIHALQFSQRRDDLNAREISRVLHSRREPKLENVRVQSFRKDINLFLRTSNPFANQLSIRNVNDRFLDSRREIRTIRSIREDSRINFRKDELSLNRMDNNERRHRMISREDSRNIDSRFNSRIEARRINNLSDKDIRTREIFSERQSIRNNELRIRTRQDSYDTRLIDSRHNSRMELRRVINHADKDIRSRSISSERQSNKRNELRILTRRDFNRNNIRLIDLAKNKQTDGREILSNSRSESHRDSTILLATSNARVTPRIVQSDMEHRRRLNTFLERNDLSSRVRSSNDFRLSESRRETRTNRMRSFKTQLRVSRDLRDMLPVTSKRNTERYWAVRNPSHLVRFRTNNNENVRDVHTLGNTRQFDSRSLKASISELDRKIHITQRFGFEKRNIDEVQRNKNILRRQTERNAISDISRRSLSIRRDTSIINDQEVYGEEQSTRRHNENRMDRRISSRRINNGMRSIHLSSRQESRKINEFDTNYIPLFKKMNNFKSQNILVNSAEVIISLALIALAVAATESKVPLTEKYGLNNLGKRFGAGLLGAMNQFKQAVKC